MATATGPAGYVHRRSRRSPVTLPCTRVHTVTTRHSPPSREVLPRSRKQRNEKKKKKSRTVTAKATFIRTHGHINLSPRPSATSRPLPFSLSSDGVQGGERAVLVPSLFFHGQLWRRRAAGDGLHGVVLLPAGDRQGPKHGPSPRAQPTVMLLLLPHG